MVYPTKAKVNLEDSVHQFKPTMIKCDDTHNTSLILLLDFTGIPIFYGIIYDKWEGNSLPRSIKYPLRAKPNRCTELQSKSKPAKPNRGIAQIPAVNRGGARYAWINSVVFKFFPLIYYLHFEGSRCLNYWWWSYVHPVLGRFQWKYWMLTKAQWFW